MIKSGQSLEFSLSFRSRAEMKQLNQTYRKKSYTPEILTFGEGLNEILICLELVREKTAKKGTDFKEDLGNLIAHGIIDLLPD